jgi:transcription elongation factor GreA
MQSLIKVKSSFSQLLTKFTDSVDEGSSSLVICDTSRESDANIFQMLAIADKVDGIAVCLVDAEAFNQPTDDALSIGIPVIGYNADTTPNARLAYVGQSLYQSGYNIAQKWLPMVKPGGNVMLSIATPGSLNLQPRLDGYIQAIKDAREKGDLSENAEYSAAKEAQGLLELKISKLEDILAHSRIIDESKIDTSSVQILNRVKIKNQTTNKVMEYQLVPESESNFKEGKIAVNSPIAKGLIGKKVGDIVKITVPSGVIPFEIIAISL